MIERPILFSAPMVRAILDSRKTQTRRVVKDVPDWCREWGFTAFTPKGGISARGPYKDNFGEKFFRCPYGAPGDRLWVRETWRPFFADGAIYLADAGTHRLNASSEADAKRMWPGWKPSIHMPRRHSRITLEVTGVRVERLQEISQADCVAEGWLDPKHRAESPLTWYSELWESINGPGSWAANPWVWVVAFRRLQS